jgi:uncharacterized protein (DUF305 family)
MNGRGVAVLAAGALVAVLGVGAAVALASNRDDSAGCAAGSAWGHDRPGMMQGRTGSRPWRGMMHGWSGKAGMMRQVRVDDEAVYLATMVAHHQEAIRSAAELARSERPQMRQLGRDIVRTQSRQVRMMRNWLAAWYPEQPAATYHPMMRDLRGLSGDTLDRAFLRDMIGHHMAAVMMSQRLLMHGLDRHPQVTRLAEQIRHAQLTEIRQMGQWLDTWFGSATDRRPRCGVG